jgi:hypothetical protein
MRKTKKEAISPNKSEKIANPPYNKAASVFSLLTFPSRVERVGKLIKCGFNFISGELFIVFPLYCFSYFADEFQRCFLVPCTLGPERRFS